MRAHVHFGSTRKYELQHAILVYTDASRAFATVHKPLRTPDGAPMLGAGQGITTDILRVLAQSLGSSIDPEILPSKVLCRTPDMLVWWTPAKRRTMFFAPRTADAERLNGKCFAHPPLVFKACGNAGRSSAFPQRATGRRDDVVRGPVLEHERWWRCLSRIDAGSRQQRRRVHDLLGGRVLPQ